MNERPMEAKKTSRLVSAALPEERPAPLILKKARTVVRVRPAGPDHQVVTVTGGSATQRRAPCSTCPWRKDASIGEFPAEAFRHSAVTAYDMSEHIFSCHQSGVKKTAVCAGFMLRGAAHNLTVRLGHMQGRLQGDVSDGGVALYKNYRAMAEANGVAPDDPALGPCRD